MIGLGFLKRFINSFKAAVEIPSFDLCGFMRWLNYEGRQHIRIYTGSDPEKRTANYWLCEILIASSAADGTTIKMRKEVRVGINGTKAGREISLADQRLSAYEIEPIVHTLSMLKPKVSILIYDLYGDPWKLREFQEMYSRYARAV